jgi:hypothetical protein
VHLVGCYYKNQKTVLSSILFSSTSYLGVWEMRRRCYIDIIENAGRLLPPPQVTQQQNTTEDGRLPTSSSPSKWYTARRELSADVILCVPRTIDPLPDPGDTACSTTHDSTRGHTSIIP